MLLSRKYCIIEYSDTDSARKKQLRLSFAFIWYAQDCLRHCYGRLSGISFQSLQIPQCMLVFYRLYQSTVPILQLFIRHLKILKTWENKSFLFVVMTVYFPSRWHVFSSFFRARNLQELIFDVGTISLGKSFAAFCRSSVCRIWYRRFANGLWSIRPYCAQFSND